MGESNRDSKADSSMLPGPESVPKKTEDNLIAVGIGASAGGLEAVAELLTYLPPTTGMAFIVVQHLDPHYQSVLPEILSGKTTMPVVQVQHETPILPDHVYVIPPNNLLLIRDRKLILEARPTAAERFRPIDALFRSLAEEFRFNAVGVILSGTATDGTLGLKSLKAEGGITFAQNQTAKFDSMPRSAISAGVVDFVLPPRRIAEGLGAISRRALQMNGGEQIDGPTLDRVLKHIHSHTGVDFRQYKAPTILRRLNRRLLVRKSENVEQYFELLRQDPGETRALFEDLLINVTGFFRDPDVFESIKRNALPSLMSGRKQPHVIRAWVPGCSTGEEVYSLAMILVEYLESEGLDTRIQMFGTDVSDAVIDRARTGIYDEASVASVSSERLRRFFVRSDSGYQISRSIREMCVFSRHNVGKDPPLSRMDLVSCRNLLIYLAPTLQQRIIATFGYALLPGGCLVLGPSETLGNLSEHFSTLDEPRRIYSRRATVAESPFRPSEIIESEHLGALPATPAPRPADLTSSGQLHNYVNRIVLSRYSPAGLVVNQDLRVVEFRGDIGDYLVTPEEQPAADLMEVVRAELRAPLSRAIEQARRTNLAVVAEQAAQAGAGDSATPAITIIPLEMAGTAQHFLILFGQEAAQRAPKTLGEAAPKEGESAEAPAAEQENVRLKRELRSTREYLQSVIEELRSTNEEAQSANEELQSTNEELQTSKEELQSSNEELKTINAEMQTRNAELARLNDDLVNLLGSMNMPIVMTGSDLRIRRFTPMAEKVLHLIPTDVGRSIADFKPRINVPDLEDVLQGVIDSLQPYEQEVRDNEGRLYLMRVRPYRTADNHIDGTVLQLLDVSELKRTIEDVRHARDYADAIVNTVREPLVVLDGNLVIQRANAAFYNATGLSREARSKETIYEVAGRRFDVAEVRALLEHLNGGAQQLTDVEIEYRSDRGESRVLSLNARRLQTPEQEQLILMAFEDITERKRAAEARYRRLFESARDGIVLVDAGTGEIIDLNPFTAQVFGYSHGEIAGRKLWEIEPLRNLPRVRAAFEEIRDRGVMRFDEVTLRKKDGQRVQVEVIANVYTEGDRRAVQFNVRDVSERKKFERELRETQKLESLGILAGGIAHDFNNLLTGMMGNASLVYTEVPADHPARGRLREIVRAGERAAFLTRQMLAYAGKGRFSTEPIDLEELIREISTLIHTSIPKSVDLRLDLTPDLPPIEADAAQIQQVIMNLVINGAEAIGEEKAGRVEVHTALREIDEREAEEWFGPDQHPAGTYIELEVRDTGSGMDEATKARIFDPFFTTKFTGRGLGLAAVQGIVRGHRGAIRVYSTPGHGTTFVVLLPAKARRTGATPEKAPALSIPEGSVALVVDDEETVRSLATSVLSRAGMTVLVAEGGTQGLEMFRQHRDAISVVVLDLLMPGIGGEEVFSEIRKMQPGVPVILSSGRESGDAAGRFSEARPDLFLPKPYTADRLVEAVASALNRQPE